MELTPEQKALTWDQKKAWLSSLRAKVVELAELAKKHPGKWETTLETKRKQANALEAHLKEEARK
jgi:hypothetical protein